MATLSELEAAEANGTIGPKGKAGLAQYRQSQIKNTAGPLPPLKGEREPSEKPPGIMSRMSGAVIGGVLRPPIELSGHLAIPIERALGKNIPPGSEYDRLSLPSWMGGDIATIAPTNKTQAVRQIAGEGIQTALEAPGIAGKLVSGVKPWVAGGRLGALFGLGHGIATAKDVNEGARDVEFGAATGAGLGATGQGIAKAYDFLSTPGKLGDIIHAGGRAKDLQIKRTIGEANIAAEERGIASTKDQIQIDKKLKTNERSALIKGRDVKQSNIGTERAEIAKQGRSFPSQAVREVQIAHDKIVDAAESNLDTAIGKNPSFLKNQVLKGYENVGTAYGKVIDQVAKGKEFLGDEWRQKVVDPAVEAMEDERVPLDSPIYKKLKALSTGAQEAAAEPEASPIVGPKGESLPPSEAKTEVPQVMKYEDLQRVNKQVFDTVSAEVKNGSIPKGSFDRWAYKFNQAQGDFVRGYLSEDEGALLDSAKKGYSDMYEAKKYLYRRLVPKSQNDVDGALRFMKEVASGDPLKPSTRANMIMLLEKGSGPLPGIGEGELTKPFAGEAKAFQEAQTARDTAMRGIKDRIAANKMTTADRRVVLQVRAAKEASDFALENQRLTADINTYETEMKRLSKVSGDFAKQRDALDQLKIRQRQLERLRNAKYAFGAAIAAYSLGENKGVLPPISKAMALFQ